MHQQTIYQATPPQPTLMRLPTAQPKPKSTEESVKKSGNKKRTLLEIPYTERDVLIAYTVFIKKYVLTTQIWQLFFRHTQNQKVCQQRMRKLCDYGILRAIEQATKRGEARKPHILALGEMGGELMIQARGVPAHLINTTPYANEENNLKIKHILAITDFQICVQASCTASSLTLETWLEDKELRHLRAPETALIVGPDGQAIKPPIADVFFVIKQANARSMWHAEIDRVTEDITHSTYERQSIIGKILEYLAWEQSDQYRQEFGKRPLRALFVTLGERRLQNMLNAVEKLMKQRVELPDVEPEDEADKQEYQKKLAEFRRLVSRFPMTTFTRISTRNVITDPVWWIAGQATPQALLE